MVLIHKQLRDAHKINSLDFTITFGKYKDKSIAEILEIDPPYVDWLADTRPHNLRFELDILKIIWAKNTEWRANKTSVKKENQEGYFAYDKNNLPIIKKY